MSIGPLDLQEYFPPVGATAWAQQIHNQGKSLEQLAWHSPDGFVAKPLYTHEDVQQYTGPMWSRGAWQYRVNLGAEGTNKTVLAALRSGATALGLDSSKGIDLAALLQSVPLDRIPLHWTAGNATLLHRLRENAEKSGFDATSLRGTMGSDATLVPEALHEIAALTRVANGTHWRTIRVDVRPFHRSGATIVQELAFAAGATVSLLAKLTNQGLHANEIANRLYYDVNVGTSYLPEVAKLRALRHLAAQLFQAYGSTGAPAFIHAETSQRSHSGIDPTTNIVRASSQAMSAIVGGCDALTVELGDPELACRMQLILKHEAHLDSVGDPGAGAYYIEALTDELGRRAWDMLQEFEKQGGFEALLRDGSIGRMLQGERHRKATAIDSGKEALVGVNAYPAPTNAPSIPFHTNGPGLFDQEPFRAAASIERVRRRTEELTSLLGHPPVAHLVSTDNALRSLKALAKRVLNIGGFVVSEAHTDNAQILVQVGRAASSPTPQPRSLQVIVTTTEEPDGTELNIYPGCRITCVLDSLLDNLNERQTAENAS